MKERPLSPHLQIYRPEITSVLSIIHRITGAGLTIGLLLVAWALWALANGAEAYACFQGFIQHPIGRLLLIGWCWALSYHLLNGVRHLFWDAGYGFKMSAARASGWSVVIFSLIMTAFFTVLFIL